MGLGRIKRNRKKVLGPKHPRGSHQFKINVIVSRGGGDERTGPYRPGRQQGSALYQAGACTGSKSGNMQCGRGAGRTPQSAVARAVRNLSSEIAKRGRRGKRDDRY